MNGLSQRQERIVESISHRTKANGYPPTIREVMEDAGLASTSAVVHHLNQLQAMGVLDWVPRSARTLRLRDRWAEPS